MSEVAGAAGTVSAASEERLMRALACVSSQSARLGGGERSGLEARLDALRA